MIMAEMLGHAGYEVVCAENAPAAEFELATQPGRFRALVTEIRLPIGDGWKLARRARELRHDLASVYVSGLADAEM